MIALLQVAAETAKEEGSHTAFYIAGGLLAGWAVLVSALGIASTSFPGGKGGRAGGIPPTVGLVLGACSSSPSCSSSARRRPPSSPPGSGPQPAKIRGSPRFRSAP